MSKDVREFMGYNVGDVVTLSDVQTQAQYNDVQVDFRIAGKRTYREPNNVFKLTCYLLQEPAAAEDEGLKLMLVVKEVGSFYDLFVYFLEEEGELFKPVEGQYDCPLSVLFEDTVDDLKDRIEATKGETTITWDKQNTSTFGVEFDDGETAPGITTLAEYFTDDENEGNNRCLVDWRGSKTKGYLEAWYGCIVQDHEVEMNRS